MQAQWDDVAVAMQVSAYSLKALADCFVPLMTEGGSLVGLDFDATGRVARVRLDGRREGSARIDLALPGAASSAANAYE